MPHVPCALCALVFYLSYAICLLCFFVSLVPPALRTLVSHMRGVLTALLPHMPCSLRALVSHAPHVPHVHGSLSALAPHVSCALCTSRTLYIAYSCASRALYIFLKLKTLQGLNVNKDLFHFSETYFSKIYLMHLKLFCYFDPFQGTLARNRLKSLILTTSKILRNIYCVSNILNFDTRVDQSAFFKDLFFDDSSKNSFLCNCVFLYHEIA